MDIFKFLKDALNACTTSRCRRYLLHEFEDDVVCTLITLHNCSSDSSEVDVNGTRYFFSDYKLPDTLIKDLIEQTRVYLNVPAIQLCTPLTEATTFSCAEESHCKVMSPEALESFFVQYLDFSRENKANIVPISKDRTITLADLSIIASPVDDENVKWLNNGGSKVSEDVCYLNNFTLPADLGDYGRTVSIIETEHAKFRMFKNE